MGANAKTRIQERCEDAHTGYMSDPAAGNSSIGLTGLTIPARARARPSDVVEAAAQGVSAR